MVEEFAALRLAIVKDLECLQEYVLPFPVVGVFFIKEPVGFRPHCPVSIQVARGKAVLGLNVDICCAVGDRGARHIPRRSALLPITQTPMCSAPARETRGISNLLA